MLKRHDKKWKMCMLAMAAAAVTRNVMDMDMARSPQTWQRSSRATLCGMGLRLQGRRGSCS